ncbi:MAG: hypothetical protein RID91_12690 [Azospirillaceae bacterium]
MIAETAAPPAEGVAAHAGSHDESAARAERVEAAALSAVHEAAGQTLRDRLGLRLETVDGALVSVAAGVPNFLLNRVIGLGRSGPPTPEGLDRIKALYAEAGIRRYFLHVTPGVEAAGLTAALDVAGFGPTRGWMLFERPAADPAPDVDGSIRVAPVADDAEAAEAGAIVAAGFDLGEAGAPVVARLARHGAWTLYLARDVATGAPTGAAAWFRHGDAGWFDFSATRQDSRRRGSQRATLARRLADARAAGVRVLFTETGEWTEGDPQHSYNNILRAGFREAGLRPNRQPAG